MRVSVLISTHALPPLSYRVPDHLRAGTDPGAAVVVPLSGRSRLGVVVGAEGEPERAREDVLATVPALSLPPDLLEACLALCDSFAVPLPAVLRAALPPGLDTGRYRIVRPEPGWPWKPETHVSRSVLKRTLGPDALRDAEAAGSVALAPGVPERGTTEWAVLRPAADPDLRRAPRQRAVLAAVRENDGEMPVTELLAQTGAGRTTLRELVRRGALRLLRRPQGAPLIATTGERSAPPDPSARDAGRAAARAVGRGGAFVWRMPSAAQADGVAAVARVVVEEGEQALVLAPEIEAVEGLVRGLRLALPPGRTVAAYHSGVGRDRAAVHGAAGRGEVDVVVGTRAAALMPLARPGALCVVDEPDGSHRASPGYEGLPVHARDVALARGAAEGMAVMLLSPVPSLRVSAPAARRRSGIRELPPRPAERWPSVRIVDMRGSGAALSSALLDSCRRVVGRGGRVGVIVDRLGYATAVTCNHCGHVARCPDCSVPLALDDASGTLACNRCGAGPGSGLRCEACGSPRISATGLTVERVRDLLVGVVGGEVGLLTAGRRELEDAPLVVGTARRVLRADWDAVALPDVDGALLGGALGSTERAFRLIYRAAESAEELLVAQTRLPEHPTLQAAARGDFEALVAAESPRLRAAGYPPFAHLAALTFTGPRSSVEPAVEFRLRPALDGEVEMSGLVAVARVGDRAAWRVLLRSREQRAVARAAVRAARLVAGIRNTAVRVDVDPEEV